MAKRRRIETWLAVGAVGVGLFLAGLLGLWAYMSATPPLYPNSQDVPSVPSSAPASKWAAAVEEARRVVRADLAEHSLPGVSVAVGVGRDIVWAEGFGWADLEARMSVSPDTRFRIGTASVALTSAAAGLLVERQALKLDERIQTYVPEFPEKQWPVTLRHVMGHVAGVRNDAGDEGPFDDHCERPVEGLKLFGDRPLLFEPGTRYRFSSFGWILVSAAIEAAAGEPFLAFMRRQIFEPLGMNDTKPESATEPVPNRATFYFPRFAADPRYGLHLMRPVDYSCYAGASVFLSTPSDLVRFGMAVNGGSLLQPATVQLLQTPQRLTSGEDTGYGLGWDIETVELAGAQARWVGHEGMMLGGMAVSLMAFPERGLVIAVTSNISWADTESLALTIAEAFARHGS